MNRHKNESGQALVETALTVPFLIMFVLGAVEFGRVAFASIEVTNAAKAGAQYASQSHNTAADIPGITTAAQSEYSYMPSALTVSVDAPACTCSKDSSPNPAVVACATNSCSTGANLEVNVTIHTSTSFDPLIHLPGLPKIYQISGQAVQKVLE
jgi:Flp pilus assembly protein TadG